MYWLEAYEMEIEMTEEIKPPGWETYDQSEMFHRAEEIKDWQDSVGMSQLARAMMERNMAQMRWEYYTALVIHLETPMQRAEREATEEQMVLDCLGPAPPEAVVDSSMELLPLPKGDSKIHLLGQRIHQKNEIPPKIPPKS